MKVIKTYIYSGFQSSVQILILVINDLNYLPPFGKSGGVFFTVHNS